MFKKVQEKVTQKISCTNPVKLAMKSMLGRKSLNRKTMTESKKKREKGCMDNKLEAILKEIKMNKNASTITNLRFDIDGTQNSQPSGSKTMESIGVLASNEYSESEIRYLRHSAKLLYENELNSNETLISNEDSEEEEYHMVTGAKRQLHRQSSQNPESLNDTTRSHADHNTTRQKGKTT